MKRVLSILAIALTLSGCVNTKTKVQDYAQTIAKQVGTKQYSYTYSLLEPSKKYLITFLAYEPIESYSLWVCSGAGDKIECNCISYNHVS